MAETRTRVGSGGRVVIPAAYRKALGVRPGDRLLLVLEGSQVRLLTPEEAIRSAQALVRRHVRKGRRLSEELLAERRREAALESRRR
jgi:AbrB family looped-hinge helix DNA binding protein